MSLGMPMQVGCFWHLDDECGGAIVNTVIFGLSFENPF
jgi:hypothetical protein